MSLVLLLAFFFFFWDHAVYYCDVSWFVSWEKCETKLQNVVAFFEKACSSSGSCYTP